MIVNSSTTKYIYIYPIHALPDSKIWDFSIDLGLPASTWLHELDESIPIDSQTVWPHSSIDWNPPAETKSLMICLWTLQLEWSLDVGEMYTTSFQFDIQEAIPFFEQWHKHSCPVPPTDSKCMTCPARMRSSYHQFNVACIVCLLTILHLSPSWEWSPSVAGMFVFSDGCQKSLVYRCIRRKLLLTNWCLADFKSSSTHSRFHTSHLAHVSELQFNRGFWFRH